MRVIDSVIAQLAPTWALNRERSRRALDIVRGYDAAQVGRRTANWRAPSGSANNEIVAGLATIRNRSRELVRNNPYAKRAINALVAKSVGVGIVARLEKSVQKPFKIWSEGCDFDGFFDYYGVQSLAARTAYESGEVVVRRVEKAGFGVQLQVLEPEYIDTSRFGPTSEGNFMIAGVEVNPAGQRVALWLFDKHPGEIAYITSNRQSKRVPWSDLIHFFERERPGQLRGVPRLAVAMMKARDLDEADDAELITKKIQACFSAFVSGGSGKALGELATNPVSKQREETLAPGLIQYLDAGETVSFGSPHVVSDAEFHKRNLRAIAVGAGVTYEMLTGDLSNVNYSSIRAGMLDFRELVDVWRWIHFIPQVCTRTYRWFEDSAWAAFKIRSTGYAIDWTPPQWPMLDAGKENASDRDEVLSGFSSVSEKIRARGRQPAEVFAEIAADKAALEKLGIVVDSDAATKLKLAEAKWKTEVPDEAPDTKAVATPP